MIPTHPTVVHMLADAAEKAPESSAVILGNEDMTYAQFLDAVAGMAHHLLDLGVRGQRVVLLLGNSLDMCIAMFAAQAAGAAAVPINPLYTTSELSSIVSDVDPRCVLCDINSTDTSQACLAELTPHLVNSSSFTLGFRHWQRAGRSLPPLPSSGKVGSIQYTGGTTGLPKGVELTHRSISTNISQREALLPTTPDAERLLCVAPLTHVYAISMALHNMVYARGTLILLPRYEPALLLNTLEHHRVTLLAGSPTLFAGLLQEAQFQRTDFSSLKASYSGAAPLPQEILRQWESATGSPVLEGYGLSEAGPVVSFNPLGGVIKPGSVGVAAPDTLIAITPEGEIKVSGPQIMQGYRNRPDETDIALREGWLHTGDLGTLDEDGYLYISGRIKDMLKVSGFSVFPREIEEVLHQHPLVTEAAVIGVPDDRKGEVPAAYILTAHADHLTEDELITLCTTNLISYKIPRHIIFRTALPRTGAGKIDKVALRASAAQALGDT